jgi:hypothetical protein
VGTDSTPSQKPSPKRKIRDAGVPAKKPGPLARRTGEGRGEGDGGRLQKPSALLDTRVVYCGDNLEQLAKLLGTCVDLIYIDPPFNANRNYEVFWGETREKRAFADRHENTKAYIDYMRPRCMQLARVLKKTGSFYYHCDWHSALLNAGSHGRYFHAHIKDQYRCRRIR